jgi:hypothetical protein
MRYFSLAPVGSNKGFKLINLTWHPSGKVLVTMCKRPPGTIGEYRLWLLDLPTQNWTYLGPYGVLGASRNGDWQLLATPTDKKNAWLVKLRR